MYSTSRVELRLGTLDLRRRKLLTVDGEIRLTAREVEVIQYMLNRDGEPVSRDDLARDIWGHGPQVQSRAVDQALKRLRKKIEVDPADPEHLITVHGVGYQFIVDTDEPSMTGSATAFVGRAEELAAIDAWDRDRGRLITIVGVGGVGKTRIAREVIARRRGRGSFCDLAMARDEDDVAMIVRRELGLPQGQDTGAVDPAEELGRALADRGPAFVVLDNAESAIEAVATVVAACLRVGDSARFLVTSREPLAIRGERVLRVGPLPVEDAEALFRQRIIEASGQFPESGTTVETVGPAVRAVECLPLAVELLAFRCMSMGGSLDHESVLELQLQDGGPRDLPERQRSLWNVVSWSWNGLTDDEARAMRRLSVACSAHTVAELEVYGLGHGVSHRRIIAQLHARSLIERISAGGGAARYRMLRPIREFSAAKLQESGEAAEAQSAFVGAMLELARQHIGQSEASMESGGTQWALGAFESLDYATRHALTRGDAEGAELALLTEEGLRAWRAPGPRNRRLDEALSISGVAPRLRMGLLLRRAIGAFYAADYKRAEALARAVSNLGETAQDVWLFARARALLGQTLYEEVRRREATKLMRDTLAILDDEAPERAVSVVRFTLVWMLYNNGDYAEADEQIKLACGGREISDLPRHLLGYSLGMRRERGDPGLTDGDWLNHMVQQREAGADVEGTLNERIRTMLDQDRLGEAEELIAEVLGGRKLGEESDSYNLQYLSDAWYLSALALSLRGRIHDAIVTLDECAETIERTVSRVKVGIPALMLRAVLAVFVGDAVTAQSTFAVATARLDEPPCRRYAPFARVVRGQIDAVVADDQAPHRSSDRMSASALVLKDGESASADLRGLWRVIVLARQADRGARGSTVAEG